jgi:hypothetical protein
MTSFEPVHSVADYYDGPRMGVADFQGVRHHFRSLVWPPNEHWDSEDDRFELTPEISSGPRVIARGTFRVRQPVPDVPLGVLRPLEVQWTVEGEE